MNPRSPEARRRWHISFRLNTYACIPGVLEEMYRYMFCYSWNHNFCESISYLWLAWGRTIEVYIKDKKFLGGSVNYIYKLASGMQDGFPTAKFCVIKFCSHTRFLALISDQSICHFPEIWTLELLSWIGCQYVQSHID